MADLSTGDHDLVAHLYAAALGLMREHGSAFIPLEVVSEHLGWSGTVVADVVDHCVEQAPAVTLPGAPGGLVADWMFDGDRPAFGRHGARFIGIRPA